MGNKDKNKDKHKNNNKKKLSTLNNFAGFGKAQLYAESDEEWIRAKKRLTHGMSTKHKIQLQKHTTVLVKQLVLKNALDELHSDLVLNHEQIEHINGFQSTEDKIRELLKLLPRLGELAYYSLRRAVYIQLYPEDVALNKSCVLPGDSLIQSDEEAGDSDSDSDEFEAFTQSRSVQKPIKKLTSYEVNPEMAIQRPQSRGPASFDDQNRQRISEISKSLVVLNQPQANWATFDPVRRENRVSMQPQVTVQSNVPPMVSVAGQEVEDGEKITVPIRFVAGFNVTVNRRWLSMGNLHDVSSDTGFSGSSLGLNASGNQDQLQPALAFLQQVQNMVSGQADVSGVSVGSPFVGVNLGNF